MALLRQGFSFASVGLIQLAVDCLLYVGLSHAGIAPWVANLCGRTSGALAGFWLNGRHTFSVDGKPRLGSRRFLRFAGLWVSLTIVSTLLVSAAASQLGIGVSWIGKPVIEGLLALVSFLAQRHWVYR